LAFFVYLDLATLSFTEILVVLQTRHYIWTKLLAGWYSSFNDKMVPALQSFCYWMAK